MTTINKTSLFTRIYSGSEKSKFLLVQQTHRCPSLLLIKSLVRKTCQNPNVKVYVVCLDTDGSQFEGMTGGTISSFIKYPGGFSGDVVEFLSTFVKGLDRMKANRVFISSLNPLLVLYSLKEVHDILMEIINASESVTAAVSQEVLDLKSNAFLSRMVSTVVVLNPSSSQTSNEVSIDITHKKKHSRLGIKVEKKTETIGMKTDGSFEVVKVLKTKLTEAKTEGDDELRGLTFNLNLSEEEKQAKDQVQLPYIK